jgi:hypothetical protein
VHALATKPGLWQAILLFWGVAKPDATENLWDGTSAPAEIKEISYEDVRVAAGAALNKLNQPYRFAGLLAY